MQFKIPQKVLMEAMQAIGAASDETIVTFGPTGARATLVDHANVMMVDVEIPASINVDHPVDIGLSFDRLYKLFEASGVSGDLTIKIDEAEYEAKMAGKLHDAKPRMYVYGYDTSFTTPLLDKSSIRKKAKIPALDMALKARVQTRELRRAVKTANVIADHMALNAALDGIGFAAEEDGYSFERWIKRSGVYSMAPSKPQRSLYSLDYLCEIARYVASEDVVIEFATDRPVRISNVRDDLKISFLLAPRIESE